MDYLNLQPGDKVQYYPKHLKRGVPGIVKRKCSDSDDYFVVYNWNGATIDWWIYTGARTNLCGLRKGWFDYKQFFERSLLLL